MSEFPYILHPTLRSLVAIGIFTCLAALVVINGVVLVRVVKTIEQTQETTTENKAFGRYHMVNYQNEDRRLGLYKRDAIAALCAKLEVACPEPPMDIAQVRPFAGVPEQPQEAPK